MAGLICSVNSGEATLVASTPKTLLQLKAATNQRAKLKSLKFLGKQTAGGLDAVVKIRLTRSTGSFGTGSAATPGKLDPSMSETVQTTASANFSAEPTSPTDTGQWYEVQPQSGLIEFFPTGLEVLIPGGAALNIEATSTGTPTFLVTAIFEE
jgi:hypothetical protein